MGKEATQPRLSIVDLRGGRNGAEPPLLLGENQCLEAMNVDWIHASFAHKRYGCSAVSLAGGPFTGVISWLGRFVPGADDLSAQLWAADDATPPHLARWMRPNWVSPVITDPITGNPWDIQGVSFKQKYVLAYQSGVNRLHCFIDDGGAGVVRRMGLPATTAAPTAANSGSGTYPAVLRFYRTRAVTMVSGVITRRSEPGPISAPMTPSGTGAGVMVTMSGAPGEGETHWELETSLDGVTFYTLAEIPIATTTYLDTVLTTAYNTLAVSEATGTYALQKPYRYIAVDGNRILGLGSYNLADPQSRLEFSGVAGSTNHGDEERVPLGNYLDLDEADSGAPTGLIGPLYGAFYLFKYHQVWKLTPTGNSTQPYSLYAVSKVIGAIHQNTIKLGEDASGNPAIYFLSQRGPYRVTLQGLEYLGLPIEDVWFGPTAIANMGGPPLCYLVGHALYHTDKRQMWFWYTTTASVFPDTKLMYDVRRSAWARNDGPSAQARCAVMFPRVMGTANSRDMKPYIGQGGSAGQLWRCDDEFTVDDVGTPFQAYIYTKPYVLGGLGTYCSVRQGTLTAMAASNVTIHQVLQRDFGQQFQDVTVSINPNASETRVQRMFEAGAMAQAWVIQVYIGDDVAVANQWTIDALTLNYSIDQAVI